MARHYELNNRCACLTGIRPAAVGDSSMLARLAFMELVSNLKGLTATPPNPKYTERLKGRTSQIRCKLPILANC